MDNWALRVIARFIRCRFIKIHTVIIKLRRSPTSKCKLQVVAWGWKSKHPLVFGTLIIIYVYQSPDDISILNCKERRLKMYCIGLIFKTKKKPVSQVNSRICMRIPIKYIILKAKARLSNSYWTWTDDFSYRIGIKSLSCQPACVDLVKFVWWFHCWLLHLRLVNYLRKLFEMSHSFLT